MHFTEQLVRQQKRSCNRNDPELFVDFQIDISLPSTRNWNICHDEIDPLLQIDRACYQNCGVNGHITCGQLQYFLSIKTVNSFYWIGTCTQVQGLLGLSISQTRI